jgi:excisionase family DNA binding protein
MANANRWLTTQDAAERACCDPREVRRAVRRGRLRAEHTRGNGLRFLEGWIDDWLANQLLPEDEGDLLSDAVPLRREFALG